MESNKLVVPLLICVVVFGGLGFYGGMTYQKQQTPATVGNLRGASGPGNLRNGAGGGNFAGRGGAGMNGANGEIVQKDATSITLKLTEGGSKNVFYATSTRVAKTSEGTMNDLSVGTNVLVTGTANPDGSVTATSIQIRPAGMMFGGPRGGTTSTQQ